MQQQSKEDDFIRVQEFIIITIFPVLHIIGLLSSVACTIIFWSYKFKNNSNIYRFLTANSLVDAFYLAFFAFIPFTQCIQVFKPWLSDYLIKIYKKYGAVYLCRALDLASALISVSIVVDRCLYIYQITIHKAKYYFTGLIVFYLTFSFVVFLPNSLYYNIVARNKTANQTFDVYDLQPSRLGRNTRFKTIVLVTQYTVSVIAVLTVIAGNVILVQKLRQQLSYRNAIPKYKFSIRKPASKSSSTTTDSEQQETVCFNVSKTTNTELERQTTMLVIWLSVFFLINQFGVQVINTAFLSMKIYSIEYNFIVMFFNLCTNCFHGGNIVIYYFYNQEFASKLKLLLKSNLHASSTQVRILQWSSNENN